jgi:hypothetical protein
VAEEEFVEPETYADEEDLEQSNQPHARIVTVKAPGAPR